MGDRASALARLGVLAFIAAFVWGCTGDDGPPGPQGPRGPTGPDGPPGPSGSVPVDSAERINIAVTSVAVPSGGGAPVVQLTLTNDLTQGLSGLPAGDIRFTIAQLTPGSAGGSSEWQSYLTRASAGIENAQATTETATAGDWVDNGDGSYQYTFSQALTDYPAGPAFDQTKSHRIGIEIRGQAPISSNGIHDFLPSGGDPTFTRNIVDNDTCFACHDRLEFHGGPRTDIAYCVTCHNPYSIDGDTADQPWGGTVDMTEMIHKIHYGENLVNGYTIIGFRGTVHDYSEVVFPQDPRNCQTCHEESDPNTPEASNWRLVANRTSCGACHDDIDWANDSPMPPMRAHPGDFAFLDDTQCLDCHGPDATINDGAAQTPEAHRVLTQEESANFQYNILDVTGTGVGETPVVTFSVTNPQDGDSPYNIQTDPEWTTCGRGESRLAISIGWNTDDYTNAASGSNPAQPVSINPLSGAGCGGASTDNTDGTFTVTSPIAVPAVVDGTLAVTMDGHPAVDTNGDGNAERIAVTNAIAYYPVTDPEAVPRRNAVAIDRCNDCHNQLSIHGNNRTDEPEVCVVCHNPNATDARQRVPDTDCTNELGPIDNSIDMKYMIHAIHASGAVGEPYELCGFRNSVHVYDFVYPGKLNNCEGCHLPGGYYPVEAGEILGTTISVGINSASPDDDLVISPNTAVCSTCHASDLAKQHMIQNGGDFEATKTTDSSLVSAGVETCALCHGPGGSSDVVEVHGVEQFRPIN